uniref:Large ribosomal subunit protein uL16m n=1 Tax=Naja naja TaxID=35670 RepID=A0A8C6V7I7_NAJNA
MWRLARCPLSVLVGTPTPTGFGGIKILTAGYRKYDPLPDYTGIVIPEKPKLKIVERQPNLLKVRRQPKNLRDIRGPSTEATEFTEGKFGILAMGGGYLRWVHFEVMRLSINRHMNSKTMFALWRVPPPYKPVTRKGLGHRMGGGKGAIDHYVSAVKAGRLIVEIGGQCEYTEVKYFLTQVAKKLPLKPKQSAGKPFKRCGTEKRRGDVITRIHGLLSALLLPICWEYGNI